MNTDIVMPGLPEAEPEVIETPILPSDVFILHYRKNNDILFLQFHFLKPDPRMDSKSHFRAAVERAKQHCERMRYRFFFCRPYVTNLDEEEKRMPI